ncbi:MAG: DMT family transporter [Pseudomonadota bacterium]
MKPFLPPGAREILVATVLFTAMNTLVKWLPRIPSHEIVFFRALVTMFAGALLLWRAGLSPLGTNRPWLLARGAFGTVALVLYFWTVQVMPLSSAVTIQYLNPLFTVLLGGLVLGERATRRQWLFFAVAFAGVPLVKGFDPRVTGLELTAGVASALFSGLAYTAIRKLRSTDHPLVVVFYFSLVTVPTVGAYSAWHWVSPTALEVILLVAVGLLTTGFQLLITRAYQLGTAASVSVYNYLGTVFAVAVGYGVFDEHVTLTAVAGFVLIIGGVVMATRTRSH